MLQVSRLLHMVAATVDGTRGFEEIAAVVGGELDRPLTGDQVRFLVEEKLVPIGVVTLDGVERSPRPYGTTCPGS